MKSLIQFINEGNELQQKVNKHITKKVSVGAVSPEGSHTDTPEKKKAAHAELKKDLESQRKAGNIGGWSGPHKGQYQYGGANEVSKEGSYLVHAKGEKERHHNRMVKTLSKIGNKHKQETILSLDKKKEGHWHHLDKSAKKGEKEYQGKLKYDKPLEKDTGRTEMKKGGHSFTTVK